MWFGYKQGANARSAMVILRPPMMTTAEFQKVFLVVSAAVVLVVVVGFWMFMRWSKTDRMKRDKAIRFYNQVFEEPKDEG